LETGHFQKRRNNDMAVNPVPEGLHTITPHLVVNDGEKALEFYKKAFGAEIGPVHKTPDGKVMHGEVKIGDSKLFLADEFPGMGCPSPKTAGGSPVVLNLYMDGIDKVFDQAVSAGATVTMPIGNQFWGDRTANSKIRLATSGRLGSILRTLRPRR
jgi:PhnB protein